MFPRGQSRAPIRWANRGSAAGGNVQASRPRIRNLRRGTSVFKMLDGSRHKTMEALFQFESRLSFVHPLEGRLQASSPMGRAETLPVRVCRSKREVLSGRPTAARASVGTRRKFWPVCCWDHASVVTKPMVKGINKKSHLVAIFRSCLTFP